MVRPSDRPHYRDWRSDRHPDDYGSAFRATRGPDDSGFDIRATRGPDDFGFDIRAMRGPDDSSRRLLGCARLATGRPTGFSRAVG
jgi:hypothetical protein